jgi:hypothetical protein
MSRLNHPLYLTGAALTVYRDLSVSGRPWWVSCGVPVNPTVTPVTGLVMSFYLGKAYSYWIDLVSSINPEKMDSSESDATAYPEAINLESESHQDDLASLTVPNPSLLPLFAEFLQDDNWWIRHFALGMLAQFGTNAKTLIELIIPLLCVDEHFLNRRQAADTLGAIGPDAAAAIPALQSVIDDEDVSEWVEAALQQIQAKKGCLD